jgi:hypothetical protein
LLNGRVRDWEAILKVAAADKALHQQSALTRTEYKLRITECSAMLHQAAYAEKQKQQRRPTPVIIPHLHDPATTQPNTSHARARLDPPSKRKQQDSTGATAAAAEHHAHTPTSATEREALLNEAENQLAHQRQHGEDPFKLLTVTTDMTTTDWFANVHRTAEAKRNQLSLLQQRINALDRNDRTRKQDLLIMSALHKAMQAMQTARNTLLKKWTGYSRRKKPRH